MKVEKQLIERNLKFDKRYQYIGITRGSVESCQLTNCDNCGKLITNMIKVIQTDNKKVYVIGTDCMETLVKSKCVYNGLNEDYAMDIYSFNKASKVATELNKGKSYIEDFIWIRVETDKGRIIETSKSDMLKFYPELIKNS